MAPIILSVAFGPAYIEQQARLAASIARTNPDVHTKHWTNEYPPGSSEHLDSLYGFKVHAIQWALTQGYKQIIWADTACIFQHSVAPWLTDKMPAVIAIKDDTKLEWTIGKFALDYMGNPLIADRHLVGGSLYVFDFNARIATHVFNKWAEWERVGLFGNQESQSMGQQNRHRHDEACMAMAMYDMIVYPLTHAQARYNTDESSVVIKKHFK